MVVSVEFKVILFVLATVGIVWVSRSSLRDVQSHGFYRFFAWETILILFLMNMNEWFVDPFCFRQIIAWLFLIASLILIYQGVQLFRRKGKLDRDRKDPGLVGIEKTTELVTTGVYHYIRHPFYSSLLFLGWGIFFKNITWIGAILAAINTILLIITARKEEIENIQYFGEKYQEYMTHTKMFVPYVF
jgi:protein-S-isoprenylcysteine O-methyltransferase Ste14